MQAKQHLAAVEQSVIQFLISQPASHIYLVGGAVRDGLLNRSSHDLDFIVLGDVFAIARALADHLHAYFYILDRERSYARVIYDPGKGERHGLDFAPVLDGDLEKDLRSRDFTINAIAQEISPHNGRLIDPCGGVKDLHERVLRPCSPSCFHDDPLRIIRVARFAVAYGLQISPEITDLVPGDISALASVSQERKRDEFFKILDGQKVAQGISILNDLGVLQGFLPELVPLSGIQPGAPHIYNGWQHTLQALHACESMADYVQNKEQVVDSSPLIRDIIPLLDEFRDELNRDFNSHLVVERSLRTLFLFSALFHDVGKPLENAVEQSGRLRYPHHQEFGAREMERRAVSLALSRTEVQWLRRFVAHHMDLHGVALSDDEPAQRAQFYRFYCAAKETTPFVALFSLADLLATYGEAIPAQRWQMGLLRCRLALDGWYNRHQELVEPQLFFNGDELQARFGVKPGKQLGELLALLKEAQAAGRVRSKPEAEQWLRKAISDFKE